MEITLLILTLFIVAVNKYSDGEFADTEAVDLFYTELSGDTQTPDNSTIATHSVPPTVNPNVNQIPYNTQPNTRINQVPQPTPQSAGNFTAPDTSSLRNAVMNNSDNASKDMFDKYTFGKK